MDEYMEDFIEDFYVDPVKIDEEYEFEASRFFDFTRPEFDFEVEEAERWFEVSGNYPPSPFFVKLNLEKLLSPEMVPNTSHEKGCYMVQDAAKVKKMSNKSFMLRSSTLMKPTASHLAKQNKAHDMNSNCRCSRSNKASQSPIRHDNPATKRQKLEIGYLKKIAHLKHQILFLHKSSKKVTIPREPELETLFRAQQRRSKNSSAPNENGKQIESNFKARPLNRNILKTPILPQSKKSPTQTPEFHEFRLETAERANRRTSKVAKENNANLSVSSSVTDSKRAHSGDTMKPKKQDASPNSKARLINKKESKFSSDIMILECLPIQQFTKLSLGSDEPNNVSKSERHASIKRCNTKSNQCGGHLRVYEAASWSNMSRSLDIR